jgi:hypothetical protein
VASAPSGSPPHTQERERGRWGERERERERERDEFFSAFPPSVSSLKGGHGAEPLGNRVEIIYIYTDAGTAHGVRMPVCVEHTGQ